MNQSDVGKLISEIKQHLKNGNDFEKKTAFRVFQKLFINENLQKQELTPIISLISEEIMDKDTLYFPELIKTVCIIGKNDLTLIKPFFKHLEEVIESQDTFLMTFVFNLLETYSSSVNIEIQNLIKKILLNNQKLFPREDLQENLFRFLKSAIGNGFGFIKEYKDELQLCSKNFTKNMPDAHSFIEKKMEEYEQYLKVEIERKKKIQLQIEEEQKRREQMRIKRAELINSINKIEESESSITEDADDKQKNATANDDLFISFSKLGLKKKENNQDEL